MKKRWQEIIREADTKNFIGRENEKVALSRSIKATLIEPPAWLDCSS